MHMENATEANQTPDNQQIEEIKDALEKSSSHNAKLLIFFILALAYILVIVASTTDLQLLSPNSSVSLPILNVGVSLYLFYIVAPIIVIVFHFNFLFNLLQHSIKLNKWDNATKGKDVELLNPFILNSLVQFNKSQLNYYLLRVILWVIPCFLPLSALVFIQWKFSKYQSLWMTTWHFIFFLVDLLFLIFFWHKIIHPDLSVPKDGTEESVWRFHWEEGLMVPLRFPFLFIKNIRGVINLREISKGIKLIISNFGNIVTWSLIFVALWYFIVILLLFKLPWQTNYRFFTIHRNLIPHLQLNEQILVALQPSDEILKWYLEQKPKKKGEPEAGTDTGTENGSLASEKKGEPEADTDKGATNASPKPEDGGDNEKPGNGFEKASYAKNAAWRDFGRGLDLQGRNLCFADFSKSNLKKADLRGANLKGAYLREAQLQQAKLANAQLQGTNLDGAYLQGAVMSGANFQGANLGRTKLQAALMSNAELQGADLFIADLQGADLVGAHLQGAILWNAILNFTNLREAELQGADLSMANLQGADLEKAKLQGADLGKAIFTGANLKDAELQGAYLEGAAFYGADLNGTNTDGIWVGESIWEEPKEWNVLIDNATRLETEIKSFTEKLATIGMLKNSAEERIGHSKDYRDKYEVRLRNRMDFEKFVEARGNTACENDYAARGIFRQDILDDLAKESAKKGILEFMKTCSKTN